MSSESDACKEALMRIYPKIDIGKIKMFIQTVPYITEQQKKFYMRYIEARYEKILKPAYQKAMQMQDNV